MIRIILVETTKWAREEFIIINVEFWLGAVQIFLDLFQYNGKGGTMTSILHSNILREKIIRCWEQGNEIMKVISRLTLFIDFIVLMIKQIHIRGETGRFRIEGFFGPTFPSSIEFLKIV